MANMSILLPFVASISTLRQMTVTYLGGAMIWVTVMSSMAAAWVAVTFVLTVLAIRMQPESPTRVNIEYAINWSGLAMCLWAIIMLLAIRVTYNRRTPRDETRRYVIITFDLIGLIVAMMAIETIYTVVSGYLAGNLTPAALIVYIVFLVVLFRGSGFLFIIFYNRLAVMKPLVEREDLSA
jgi:hypothetical protein